LHEEAEFEKKSAAAKEVGDMMEIVKTLRANGLPAEVTDHDAAAAYKKLFELLKGVHAAGHSPRKAMEWWVKHEEIGNEHASKEEIAVIDAVLKLGSTPGAILPQPGHHKHVEPEPESDDLPVPDPEDDDEDLMDDEDDDLSQAPAPEPEPEPEPTSAAASPTPRSPSSAIPRPAARAPARPRRKPSTVTPCSCPTS
jgi:hypothetical protein